MKKRLKTFADKKREEEWDMGQARTCLVCGDVFLTKKYLRIHRANHRNKEIICEKTGTT